MSLEHSVRMLVDFYSLASSTRSPSRCATARSSKELGASLHKDLELVTNLDPRYRRLNYEEPYRLKLTCIRAKLESTLLRMQRRSRHQPGIDYASSDELLDDLMLLYDSLDGQRAEHIARGTLEQSIRTVAAFGLTLTTLDVREHAEAHHARARPL